jgi:hypothetical protein
MKRPVMLGVAITNRPHIRLKNHPISFVEKEGEEYLRVPIAVQGLYRHPQGDLDFNDDTFKSFLENQKKGIADYDLGLDAKHLPQQGYWAWFEESLNGNVQQEVAENGDKLLVAYGKPTTDGVKDLLKKNVFRYASLEFHPNYRSNLKSRYLSDDLTAINISNEILEVNMDFKLELNEDGGAELTKEQVEALQQLVKDGETAVETITSLEETAEETKTKLQEATEKIDELESKLETSEDDEEIELSEREKELYDRIQVLEQQSIQAEKEKAEQWVDLKLEKAKGRTDENGMIHSAVFLNVMRALMLGDTVKDDNKTIELEDATDAASYGKFVREICAYALTTVPGQVQGEGITAPDDERKLEDDQTNVMFEAGKKAAASIYGAM